MDEQEKVKIKEIYYTIEHSERYNTSFRIRKYLILVTEDGREIKKEI